jgi:hypothetical protein
VFGQPKQNTEYTTLLSIMSAERRGERKNDYYTPFLRLAITCLM